MTGRLFIAPLAALLVVAAVARGLEIRGECENHVSAKSPLCSELYQSLQAALVGSETDLYNLRKIFFPSSSVIPTLVNTSYELVFENVPNTPCPDAEENATFLNTSETIHRSFGWTSKVLYTIFHPATLNRLQPQLFYTMMTAFESETSRTVETAFYWEGVDPYLTLELFLKVKGLSCTPSYGQLDNTLKDVTSVLKLYAQDQANITTWKSSDSYVLDRRVFAPDWWRHEFQVYGISSHLRLINFIISLVVTTILTIFFTGILGKVENEEKNNFSLYHSALWTATGILSLLCVALYITEIVKVGIWWHHSTAGELAINIVWFVIALAYAFMFNICVYKGVERYEILSPSRAIVPGMFLGIRFDTCCCCCFSPLSRCYKIFKDTYILKFIPLVVFFLSAGFIIINIIPVTLYFLIYPIRVLAFYSFVATALVLQLLALTTIDLARLKAQESGDTDGKQVCTRFCSSLKYCAFLKEYFLVYAPLLTTVFIALLTILFISIYRTLVSEETTRNYLHGVLKSLISPLILFSPIVWIVKKMKEYMYKEENETSNRPIHQVPD